ncbi:hypothetical protein MAR_033109 [Mya arenaria]|uniref:Uncharacterized protein n=1 Tax=Mya arenaria TaxID=6604 RepID=A0ABY7GB48_MYAAR|nr:hypothetical protein MAR_033109 [Mya arenaria]
MSTSSFSTSFQNKINELEKKLIAENKSRERDRGRPSIEQPARRPKPCALSVPVDLGGGSRSSSAPSSGWKLNKSIRRL